mmetsp:Transcript_11722/g.39001  ORF Transcript_11722/g.39001 Transcript_11722/m.39001 type:complete len:308 (+) Transcript_11722:551-1474(+)
MSVDSIRRPIVALHCFRRFSGNPSKTSCIFKRARHTCKWPFSFTLTSFHRAALGSSVLHRNALFNPGCPTSCADAAMSSANTALGSIRCTKSDSKPVGARINKTACTTSAACTALWYSGEAYCFSRAFRNFATFSFLIKGTFSNKPKCSIAAKVVSRRIPETRGAGVSFVASASASATGSFLIAPRIAVSSAMASKSRQLQIAFPKSVRARSKHSAFTFFFDGDGDCASAGDEGCSCSKRVFFDVRANAVAARRTTRASYATAASRALSWNELGSPTPLGSYCRSKPLAASPMSALMNGDKRPELLF